MLAIFRANPAAFDGNINRLHRGAVLIIPSHADVAAILIPQGIHDPVGGIAFPGNERVDYRLLRGLDDAFEQVIELLTGERRNG